MTFKPFKRTKLPYTGNWICRNCGSGNHKDLKACAWCPAERS